MPILTENIISVFRRQYGKKGDKVKIISDRGNVLIVENKEGVRFSVKKEKVRQ